MATIVVEDGTEIAGANSYISEADLTTYATDRGITLTIATDILIIQAMDYIESLSYIGHKKNDTQALVWPRDNVVIDGFSVSNLTIPQLLIDGLAEVAIAVDNGNSPLASIDRATQKEKVGEIEVEYMDNASATVLERTINTKLGKLLDGNASGLTLTVIRV